METVEVWLEDKYAGIRCQLHKVGSRVALFSRDLKEVSAAFEEIALSARNLTGDVVLDGEILAMQGEQVLPFAELQKRLGRREADLFLREELPVQFVAFDLLWHEGVTWINRPLRERRAALERLELPLGLHLARFVQGHSPEAIRTAFDEAKARGNEGLVAKDPFSLYAPGRRGLAWLMLKQAQ